MKVKERREVARKLVKELEDIKKRSVGSGIRVKLYSVTVVPLRWLINCGIGVGIACIILAMPVFKSDLLSRVGVVILLVMVLMSTSLNNPREEISCTKRSVAKLQKEVDECRRKLEKFEKQKEEAEEARKELSELEQMVVNELKGRLNVYPKGNRLQIYVKIGCKEMDLPLNHDNCEQVWKFVAVARKLHEWTIELKEELGVV